MNPAVGGAIVCALAVLGAGLIILTTLRGLQRFATAFGRALASMEPKKAEAIDYRALATALRATRDDSGSDDSGDSGEWTADEIEATRARIVARAKECAKELKPTSAKKTA